MVKCKSCGRKVPGKDLVCCHCCYPLAVAKAIPWPLRLLPVAPQQFWKATMLVSLFLAALSAYGIFTHGYLSLSSFDCTYSFLLFMSVFIWAFVGSRKELR